jgi:hypothetical protein
VRLTDLLLVATVAPNESRSARHAARRSIVPDGTRGSHANTGPWTEKALMSREDVLDARQFVANVDLEGVPTHGREYLVAPLPRFIPRPDEEQAIVVGSQLQAFSSGVDETTRRTLENAMLLAQLAAQKAAADDAAAWYRTYFDTLSNIGLRTEERNLRASDTGTIQADIEKVVLELASGLLGGPATTAYQMVASTLAALQKLDQGSPAVTIFRRETHRETGRFQVSVAEQDAGGLAVSLIAFTLEASVARTQVLFFKLRAEDARVSHLAAKLGVNEDALAGVAPLIAQKVAEYTDGYVRQLQI